jgi:hypothetical protein
MGDDGDAAGAGKPGAFAAFRAASSHAGDPVCSPAGFVPGELEDSPLGGENAAAAAGTAGGGGPAGRGAPAAGRRNPSIGESAPMPIGRRGGTEAGFGGTDGGFGAGLGNSRINVRKSSSS